jgi:hypothetical protein
MSIEKKVSRIRSKAQSSSSKNLQMRKVQAAAPKPLTDQAKDEALLLFN